jgi:hypothetical protein
MDEIASHPEKIPMGSFEMIYNTATGFNIINEKDPVGSKVVYE